MVSARDRQRQDRLYEEAVATFGAALERLARGYESDTERRRDLLQEIHVALWRSFGGYNEQCSLRTWVYRVAHNKAISIAVRRPAERERWLTLDHVESMEVLADADRALDEQRARARLQTMIQSLKPLDRQVILLYLEGLDAAAIAEITGLSAGSVATRVHRIKHALVDRFHEATR